MLDDPLLGEYRGDLLERRALRDRDLDLGPDLPRRQVGADGAHAQADREGEDDEDDEGDEAPAGAAAAAGGALRGLPAALPRSIGALVSSGRSGPEAGRSRRPSGIRPASLRSRPAHAGSLRGSPPRRGRRRAHAPPRWRRDLGREALVVSGRRARRWRRRAGARTRAPSPPARVRARRARREARRRWRPAPARRRAREGARSRRRRRRARRP